ncbi:MAG: hypothetical protein ACFB0B_21445 [Thermonemataceae bacterium]
MKETSKFAACDFSYSHFKSARLAGVNLLGIANLRDLNPLDGALLLKAFSEKKLLLTLDFVVDVKNPNAQKASLSRLEWIAQLDKVKLAEGVIADYVEVPPLGKAEMPLRIETDLVGVFNQKDSQEVLGNLIKLVSGNEADETTFVLKMKPSFRVGKKNKLIKSPVYIKVKQKL